MTRRAPVRALLLLTLLGCSNGLPPTDPGGQPAPGEARADLLPAGLEAPAEAEAGGAFTMHVGVRNAGSLDVGPGWMVRVYLSADAAIEPSDTLIDQFVTSRDLGAGRSDSYLRNKKLSGLLPPGTYFIGSIVDATGLVSESIETNNTLANPPQVTIAAAPVNQ